MCRCFDPGGVSPTSEFVCVLPFPNGDARVTQRFILVRAKEGPMSSAGRLCIILHRSACIGVNTNGCG